MTSFSGTPQQKINHAFRWQFLEVVVDFIAIISDQSENKSATIKNICCKKRPAKSIWIRKNFQFLL